MARQSVFTRGRQSAPPDVIPGELDPVRLAAFGEDASVVLARFEASSAGLFCAMMVQARPPVEFPDVFNFNGRPEGATEDLCIWAEYDGREVLSEYQSSWGARVPGGSRIGHRYNLWFPIPALVVDADVDVRVSWVAIGAGQLGVTIAAASIRIAAEAAIEWTGALE
jgi:hypothetical protein